MSVKGASRVPNPPAQITPLIFFADSLAFIVINFTRKPLMLQARHPQCLIDSVPADGFLEAVLEPPARLPAQFATSLRAVNRITAVVAQAVGDVLNERWRFAERREDKAADLQIRPFGVAAQAVRFPGPAVQHRRLNAAALI